MADAKIPVHVEVCLNPNTVCNQNSIAQAVIELISSLPVIRSGVVDVSLSSFLQENTISIVCDLATYSEVSYWQAEIRIHTFYLSEEGPSSEELEGNEEISACDQWVLPAKEFNGMWESLIFDSEIKTKLLRYACTAMVFADRNVNSSVISLNRVVLLHGPPGTGKTSLCKALAHKLSIRLSERFPQGHLIEINAHSLFSKWFSESGKLVMRLFQHIKDLIEDESSFVCVLIDEVESLTAARKSALSGNEPSDAIRVVNALLTQIDHLRDYSNVLILTTSNITEAIDLAFVDRADIKQFIGLPSTVARYQILRSCVEELMRVGILPQHSLIQEYTLRSMDSGVIDEISAFLYQIADEAEGLSGRALRKLPFIAYAFFVEGASISVMSFLNGLKNAVLSEHETRSQLPDSSLES